MPMYSLGVFGPFAHRTLILPRSPKPGRFCDAAQFRQPRAPTSATLTARAFTPTGRLYNDQGVVIR